MAWSNKLGETACDALRRRRQVQYQVAVPAVPHPVSGFDNKTNANERMQVRRLVVIATNAGRKVSSMSLCNAIVVA